MSRALDPSIASSISKSKADAQKIYNNIASAIRPPTTPFPNTSSCRLKIEFLGKEHELPPVTYVLTDDHDGSVGVSKAKLVQAFIVARKILFDYLASLKDGSTNHTKASDVELETSVQDATAVMLLMDPEHLTAANTRKRLILRHIQHGDFSNVPNTLDRILERELHFVDSYLASYLHRHNKSPTLWSHRRWILEHMDISQRDLTHDMTKVVLVAADRHPRNYYAFTHARWLLRQKYMSSSGLLSMLGEKETQQLDEIEIISTVKSWCSTHPSDTSGFSFMLFCVSQSRNVHRVRGHGLGPDLDHLVMSSRQMSSAVCQDTLRLAVSLRWTGEAVWVFLRTLVAESGKQEDRAAFHEVIGELSKKAAGSQKLLEKAGTWCRSYQQSDR